ncbi:ankyrin repeat and zinc finger domain-containing 1 isoform X1 [Pelobates cultripes]|uniref:Ankyrin repeat and zinc finger domain-containing 1 isoform X1 n=1 Tax=Pelobates cultripes TaxID=61616 RepID=A0AAD1SL93_PELCU|nr:ankyrin repeat and zinc finger domain-containing 1 isoform X1 [Pelobates cultripes]
MDGVPSVQNVSLFGLGLECSLLSGLSHCTSNGRLDISEHPKSSEILANENMRNVGVPEVSDRLSCSTCQCLFDNREEQKEHYTLDWHRFNLKRRIKGAAPLSSEEFQEKTRDGDVSSISGSDTESSDDDDDVVITPEPEEDSDSVPYLTSRSQRCLFRNSQGQLLSMYRCVLGETKNTDAEPGQLLNCVKSMQEQPILVILMAGGGHFAGAVYKGKEILKHKTFHRYTVRAKRGTSQAVHDAQNRSHMPKSAGAALRRYNQAALITDITQLLQSWADHMKEARGIFLRAPRTDRTLFLGRDSPIPRKDPRVHGVPFITRRATFREVQRVHSQLFTLQVYDKDISLSSFAKPKVKIAKAKKTDKPEPREEKAVTPDLSEDEEPVTVNLVTEELTLRTLDLREYELYPKRKRKKKKKKNYTKDDSKEPDGEEDSSNRNPLMETYEDLPMSVPEEDEQCQIRNTLFTCCKTGDSQKAKEILQVLLNANPELPPSTKTLTVREMETLVNERLPLEGRTLLHMAASSGHGEVACLLMDAGWDPSLRDSAGQTPYSLSPNKATRNRFRKYREDNPERFNYSKSQIPGPVSEEAEALKAKKKQAYKAQKKQREKEEKEERKRKEEEEAEKRRFAALSDREKRALAAERRFATQLNNTKGTESGRRRCWQCGESLLGKVPFEYLDFYFCSTRCLQEHRRSKAAK